MTQTPFLAPSPYLKAESCCAMSEEEHENRGPDVPPLPAEDFITHEPRWFRDCLAEKPESRWVESEGTAIHYLKWAAKGADKGAAKGENRPGLLFVHGNGAHARWFDFIAPLLTDRYQVASIDLPGMGDSHWRDSYTRETYANAIHAVAVDADLGPKPVIVGHSFGGFVTLITGAMYGAELGGIILADFRVRPPEDAVEWFLGDPPRRPTRIYPDFETALGRFRLAPLQECANKFITDYIGRHSLREVKVGENEGRRPSEEAGWSWKFDPFAFQGLRMGGEEHADMFRNLACKVGVMYGDISKDYDPETMAFMQSLRPEAPIFTVPFAQHHIMLDQPVAFAASVTTLMADWEAKGALSGAKAKDTAAA